jgi:hypothetical protein
MSHAPRCGRARLGRVRASIRARGVGEERRAGATRARLIAINDRRVELMRARVSS